MTVVRVVHGDLLAAKADALVNAVNCKGVMGKGIAAQFKVAYPSVFEAYEAACDRGEVEPGRMFVVELEHSVPRWIIHFPTKRHWRAKSRIEDVDAGLPALRRELVERGIRSVAMPALGCGLGGLSWDDVRPRIEAVLGELTDVEVLVYAPQR